MRRIGLKSIYSITIIPKKLLFLDHDRATEAKTKDKILAEVSVKYASCDTQ